jgi:hypothetical protein
MKLIVCGSATTWMIKNIIDSHGGLHDRITHEMKLLPFTLNETEQYLINNGFHWSHLSIVQSYMMFGGVAYYLSLMDSSLSLTQNIDIPFFRICNSGGENISICNAGKQRYAATADLFRIYVRFVSLT